MKEAEINIAPIFTALTRPPMMFGVTLDYLAVAVIFSMCLFVGAGNPLYLVSYLPLHVAGWVACRYDPNLFRVLFKKLDCPPTKNKHYWGCQSYDPS